MKTARLSYDPDTNTYMVCRGFQNLESAVSFAAESIPDELKLDWNETWPQDEATSLNTATCAVEMAAYGLPSDQDWVQIRYGLTAPLVERCETLRQVQDEEIAAK